MAECPNHHTHAFNFNELEVGTGSNQQPYFRALVFFYKKPGLTDEFFHEHWKSVHADLTMSTKDAGVNLVRYVQFHQDSEHKKMIAPLVQSKMKLLSYDGCAEFMAKDAASFLSFMDNIYGSKELVGCGSRFVDLEIGYDIMVGYDNLIFGKSTESSDYDGISQIDSRLNPGEKTESGKE